MSGRAEVSSLWKGHRVGALRVGVATALVFVAAVEVGATTLPPPTEPRARAADPGECQPTTMPPPPVRKPLIEPPVCGPTRGWESKAGQHVRVWWRTADKKLAGKGVDLAFDVLEHQAWNPLVALARAPVSDREDPCPGGKLPGGDDKLDVYFTNLLEATGLLGQVPGSEELRGKPRSAYILVERELLARSSLAYAKVTIAHEFFHVIQAAYPRQVSLAEAAWWHEATAEWAALQVFPDPAPVEGKFCAVLANPELPLYSANSPAGRTRFYGAVLFPWMVTQQGGPKSFVAKSLENLASAPPYEAIDQALPGGFAQWWPRFARFAWNRAPWNELERADSKLKAHRHVQDLPLDGEGFGQVKAPSGLNPLSVSFEQVHLTDDIRTLLAARITSLQPLPPGVTMQVLGLRPGATEWTVLDGWTPEGEVLCHDLQAERYTDLVFVLANASRNLVNLKIPQSQSPFPVPPPLATATDVPCAGWQGAMSFSCARTLALGNGEARTEVSGLAAVEWRRGESEIDERGGVSHRFFVQRGAVDLATATRTPQCSCGPATRHELASPELAVLAISDAIAPRRDARRFSGAGQVRLTADWGHCACLGEDGPQGHAGDAVLWFNLPTEQAQTIGQGDSLFGHAEVAIESGGDPRSAPRCQARWDLKARRDG